VRDPKGGVLELPGVAPVAIQQGHYAVRLITDRLEGRPTRPFHYLNKGNLATIGRGRAVADLGLDPSQRASGMADLAVRSHLLSDRISRTACS